MDPGTTKGSSSVRGSCWENEWNAPYHLIRTVRMVPTNRNRRRSYGSGIPTSARGRGHPNASFHTSFEEILTILRPRNVRKNPTTCHGRNLETLRPSLSSYASRPTDVTFFLFIRAWNGSILTSMKRGTRSRREDAMRRKGNGGNGRRFPADMEGSVAS